MSIDFHSRVVGTVEHRNTGTSRNIPEHSSLSCHAGRAIKENIGVKNIVRILMSYEFAPILL